MSLALKLLLNQPNFRIADAMAFVRDGEDPKTENDKGDTLLHLLMTRSTSFSQEVKEAIIELTQKHKVDINLHNGNKKTPLQCLLSQKTNIEDIMFLVRLGANPKVVDLNGETLLHRTVIRSESLKFSKCRIDALIELTNKQLVDINLKNESNQTPLQCLMNQTNWNASNAMFLVGLGANPNDMDSKGQPLIHALANVDNFLSSPNNQNLMTQLVRQYKADINSLNKEGQTPFQVIQNRENPDIDSLLFLIELGADPNSKNSKGDTFLHLLMNSKFDYSDVIRRLSKTPNIEFSIKNFAMNTPFDTGIEALITNRTTQIANLMTLVEYSDKVQKDIGACFQANKIACTNLNRQFNAIHSLNLKGKYELQGKIREIAFEEFKNSIEELPADERLDKLKWARTQPIFCAHRADFFLAKIGRTHTVTLIDKMISDCESDLAPVDRAATVR